MISDPAKLASATSRLDEPLLRELFERAVKHSRTVGAQLSIIKGDQQIELASGLAHASRDLAMTPDTLMKIGSVTKVFNAALIIGLAHEKLLDLDVPVATYVPRLELEDAEAARRVTLRNLLSMCSGLDNGPYSSFGGGENALAQYVGALKSLPQHFPVGKYFGYSNAGTCIAGFAASRQTGTTWERLLRERILRPAGLTRSAVLEGDVLYRTISAGHEFTTNGGTEIIDPTFTMSRSMSPAGISLALCAGDLARFGMIFIRRGLADTGARILEQSSIDEMLLPQTPVPIRKHGADPAWCLGPHTCLWNGVRVFGHAGVAMTSSSFLYWIPSQQGCIAFIVNTNAAMGEFAKLMFSEALEAAFGFKKPGLDMQGLGTCSTNARRYVGTYQRLGATMLVTRGEQDVLTGRYIPEVRGRGSFPYGSEQQVILTPLADERFRVDSPDSSRQPQGSVDTAFFGEDDQGRASNVLDPAGFTMRRID